MLKLRAGDKVKILLGKDKGRDGEIERIFVKEGKVLVPGLNIFKKHVKGTPGQKGGIYEVPRPMPFGKVALICPKCKKPTRVGLKEVAGEKVRYCKKCRKEIDTK
jgi:large subunit ribosomal protein L24